MPAITSLAGNRQINAVDNIRNNLSAEQASTDFSALRTLVGRNSTSTAQIKLVHTTDPEQRMTFETKGWWGRKFSSTEKLVRTNAAILEIVKKTGLPETSTNFRNLKAYLDEKTAEQRAGSARGLNGLLDAIQKELSRKPATSITTGRSVHDSLGQQGYDFAGLDTRRGFIASGGHGQIYGEGATSNKGVLYKEFRELGGDRFLPKVKVRQDQDGQYRMDRDATELAAVSLRNGKVPHAANPLAYVIKDSYDDVYHTVSVDHMKGWAAENGERIAADGDRFVIVGQVLPKAEGVPTAELKNLTLADKAALARQSMESLKAMAEHGYVHGDIKPANVMYSAKDRQMTLIDFGGLSKQSKGDESGQALGNPLSPTFVIPSEHHASGANNTRGYGYEADLYAMGLTLLNVYLPNSPQVQALMSHDVLASRDAATDALNALRSNQALVEPGSPEDLAVQMMTLALAPDQPLIGRLGGSGALSNPALEHLWQQILDHPVMK